jgi:hypothetical protein
MARTLREVITNQPAERRAKIAAAHTQKLIAEEQKLIGEEQKLIADTSGQKRGGSRRVTTMREKNGRRNSGFLVAHNEGGKHHGQGCDKRAKSGQSAPLIIATLNQCLLSGVKRTLIGHAAPTDHFLSAGGTRYDAFSRTLGEAMRRRQFIAALGSLVRAGRGNAASDDRFVSEACECRARR